MLISHKVYVPLCVCVCVLLCSLGSKVIFVTFVKSKTLTFVFPPLNTHTHAVVSFVCYLHLVMKNCILNVHISVCARVCARACLLVNI